ncbi:hypothetical protein LES60_06590 [Pectobacterium brasiliense]|nr:hypothetical protein [Pectobacterium brasiliense]MCA5926319.1 hypothetical protein [Pectobacterium brasiliense]MCA5935665.1 hypothetical protein [Pectobacterium brasiliense]MCA5941596.1 hypothetical protein [Pectobacterium brasiliense]MCA5943278.1 hypothetical protein [Pectobacterium brasiliense]
MQAWKPGECLLSEFDIKIGRLSASVRKKNLTQQDIDQSCADADSAIEKLRQDHDRPVNRRRTNRTDGL